jgi:hypothetical protein
MKTREGLKLLAEAESALPDLIRTPSIWRTLDVTYEPPRVERLWTEWGDGRLYLHRIHPCEKALFHPHPWPSAIKILSGSYEMAVGYQEPGVQGDAPVAATLILTAGACYEMVSEAGWHYVRPLGGPSLSIMITGKPWSPQYRGKGQNQPLPEEAKQKLLTIFEKLYPLPQHTDGYGDDWDKGWGHRRDE